MLDQRRVIAGSQVFLPRRFQTLLRCERVRIRFVGHLARLRGGLHLHPTGGGAHHRGRASRTRISRRSLPAWLREGAGHIALRNRHFLRGLRQPLKIRHALRIEITATDLHGLKPCRSRLPKLSSTQWRWSRRSRHRRRPLRQKPHALRRVLRQHLGAAHLLRLKHRRRRHARATHQRGRRQRATGIERHRRQHVGHVHRLRWRLLRHGFRRHHHLLRTRHHPGTRAACRHRRRHPHHRRTLAALLPGLLHALETLKPGDVVHGAFIAPGDRPAFRDLQSAHRRHATAHRHRRATGQAAAAQGIIRHHHARLLRHDHLRPALTDDVGPPWLHRPALLAETAKGQRLRGKGARRRLRHHRRCARCGQRLRGKGTHRCLRSKGTHRRLIHHRRWQRLRGKHVAEVRCGQSLRHFRHLRHHRCRSRRPAHRRRGRCGRTAEILRRQVRSKATARLRSCGQAARVTAIETRLLGHGKFLSVGFKTAKLSAAAAVSKCVRGGDSKGRF